MEAEHNTNEVHNDDDTETEQNISRKKRVKSYKARKEYSLRTEHSSRLSRILNDLIKERNWKEASGVLSVLLKGTVREEFPEENRKKYLATMELLKKMDNDHIKLTNIKHVYEIWMRKNGAMKKCAAKDKFSTLLEYVLFCLTHGNLDGAHQAMISLMQEKEYGNDPMVDMMAGLVYYELWYSCIPEEMKLERSDIFGTTILPELSELGSYNPVESTCCNSFDDQDVESPARDDSTSSVGNIKNQQVESFSNIQKETSNQGPQPRGFYINESAEMSGDGEANHEENLTDTSVFKFRGLDVNLLPLRLPERNENFGNSIHKYMRTLNDYYSMAVKYLRSALHSTPPVLASFLPLVQLLLLGDQVEEALKEIENMCQTSKAALPLRIRVILLECLDSKNSIKLSACYEDIMNIDPTCNHSLTRLIAMHKNGDYGLVPLLEIIALHLDATYAECSVWAELATCFLKLSHYEEDQLSVCGNAMQGIDESRPACTNAFPLKFIHPNSRKSWEIRCRWWSRRHFSKNAHVIEKKAGDWELLTSKAACASHLYGPEFWYVASVDALLAKEEKGAQEWNENSHYAD